MTSNDQLRVILYRRKWCMCQKCHVFYIIFYFGHYKECLRQIKVLERVWMDDECLNALLWHIGASVQFFLWFQQDFGASEDLLHFVGCFWVSLVFLYKRVSSGTCKNSCNWVIDSLYVFKPGIFNYLVTNNSSSEVYRFFF